MHWYKKNIGDYSKKAGRLSMLQHGAYTLLIDACYDRERFPTLEEAMDWTWASSKEEVEAVEFVLRKFFTLEDGVYVQRRIKDEIEAYRQKAENNKRIAEEREAARKRNSTNRAPVANDSGTDRHLTKNQEPRTNNQDITPHTPQGGHAPEVDQPDQPDRSDHPAKRKGTGRQPIGIKAFIDACKADGVAPIPADDPVFDYAEKIGIPHEFLKLAWREFVARHRDGDKRYRDWRKAFRNCVRANWYRLWWLDPVSNQYVLTTTGMQAQRVHQEAA